jgi:hypothetical protein
VSHCKTSGTGTQQQQQQQPEQQQSFDAISESSMSLLPTQPPQFTLPLQDRVLNAHDHELVFKCIVQGFPLPTVRWHHNGQQLMENEWVHGI